MGYVSAEEIVAKEPFPPFRASIKDGYAVRLYSDRSHEQIYEIMGRADAGGENVTEEKKNNSLVLLIFLFQTNIPLSEGQCIVINTGAKLPDSANAVIQIEDTQVHEWHSTKKDGLNEKSIRITTECSMNQDIRYIYFIIRKSLLYVMYRNIGDDVNVDELVLEKNVSLGPAELGLLVTVGLQKLCVYDKPRVAVLSTGNEVSFIIK